MEWVAASVVFLAAIGFLAWKQGGWYAAGIAVFLILTALVYTLVKRHFGEQGAVVFSLIALLLAVGATWLIRKKSKS
jgi:LPXTG-motif cell wall-anchored protein